MELTAILAQLDWPFLLFGALSLSIGWGIRGNFGHEYGAALPGTLATMALVIVSGRLDWLARLPYFALFGALGWSFGGSMSYMQVIAYTHSGHPASVLYGFANLFVIGFLWAFLGCFGSAMPAFLGGPELALFAVPLIALAVGWGLKGILVDWIWNRPGSRRHENPLYWYDTDWLAALTAIVVALLVALLQGGFTLATSLMLYAAVGWFGGFLLLVNLLRLRMTPPRGDNWSGCIGMVAGILLYCWHYDLGGLAFAGLMGGMLGGLAFSMGQLIKLLWIRTGWQTNWHSVMEQTQGFLFGLGLGIVVLILSASTPSISLANEPPQWMAILATAAWLVGLSYLNHRKAALTWVEQVESLPERFYRLPVTGWLRHSRGWVGWFELLYLGIGIVAVVVLRRVLTTESHLLLLQAQILYLLFLWWIVIYNFERALVGFSPPRIVTEGVITLNALVVTLLAVLLIARQGSEVSAPVAYGDWIRQSLIWLIPGCILLLLLTWGLTHMLYGRQPAPHAGRHIRFGSEATVTKAKPQRGADHP